MAQYRTMENYHGELETLSTTHQPTLSTTNSTAPLEINNAEDKQKLLARYPIVVVLVYATWCGPCKAFKPEYARYAIENVSKAYFCQENSELRLTDGIRGIPTVVVYKNGRVLERIVGGDLARLTEILPPM